MPFWESSPFRYNTQKSLLGQPYCGEIKCQLCGSAQVASLHLFCLLKCNKLSSRALEDGDGIVVLVVAFEAVAICCGDPCCVL